MNSIGKVNASAISATTEFTVAAASLNFDFSLVKIEAPPEFQALGQCLSQHRKREAEDGAIHITARKLAALFEPLLDRTPELIKAYGHRVSEIASSPDVNPKGSKQKHGMFSNQVGADATSIWAAATSGHSAIAIHLLACMLARIWPTEEAVAIWCEIVNERKLEIQNDHGASEFEKLARNAAASQEITREQLTHWDASARAWLECADQAKVLKLKQIQLLLVLKNVALPVNTASTAYKSVVHAWKSAMALTENLVKGQPQEAHDGAILLGLSAWHLHPDLVVLGQKSTNIVQSDPLIPRGGTLTLGMLNRSPGVRDGVSWSLPLASLNFYGDPVTSTQSLNQDSPRLSMQQLCIVALGSILFRWDPASIEFAHAAECLVELWAFCTRADFERKISPANTFDAKSESLNARRWHWLKMLSEAAHAFLTSTGLERNSALRLIHFGRRRAKDFLAYDQQRQQDFLGLHDTRAFIHALKNSEIRISYLRSWIDQFAVNDDDVVIQYQVRKPKTPSEQRQRVLEEMWIRQRPDHGTDFGDFNNAKSKFLRFEYATAVSATSSSSKHDRSGKDISTKYHKRWIAAAPLWERFTTDFENSHDCTCENSEVSSCRCLKHMCKDALSFMDISNPARQFWTRLRLEELSTSGETILLDEQRIIYPNCFIDSKHIIDENGYFLPLDFDSRPQDTGELIWHGSPRNPRTAQIQNNTKGQKFVLLWGHPVDAAIFIRSGVDRGVFLAHPSSIISFWTRALKEDAVDFERVSTLLWVEVCQFESYFSSLDALSIAAELYQTLPYATIHPTITSQALRKALWYRSYSTSRSTDLSLRQQDFDQMKILDPVRYSCNPTKDEGFKVELGDFRLDMNCKEIFACVAMFERGRCDINPEDLCGVMAFSSGNSIYISNKLLQDPSDITTKDGVVRVPGNISQANIAFLVPPQRPKVRKVDEFAWNVINHSGFDGKAEDSFTSTSCHLSFTDYRRPVTLANHVHGRYNVEMIFIESVVSVYDCGRWVADLDILSTLLSDNLYRSKCSPKCRGKSSWNSEILNGHVTAVDSWDEILERPQNTAVVRAHGNWLARLAMTSFAVGRGYRVVVLPHTICWGCCAEQFPILQGDEVFII